MKLVSKKITKRLFVFALLLGALFFTRLVLAADFGTDQVNNGLGNSLATGDPRALAGRIINIVLGFLGVIAVGIIMWGGFVWMTSDGNEEKVSEAKKILRNGVIGLLIILSSWAIATFILMKLGGAANGTGGDTGCFTGETQSCGCGGSMVCTNGSWGGCVGGDLQNCVNPPTSCDASPNPGCQANSQICAPGYYCDNSCLCQVQGQSGDSCDGDLTNQKCDADNSRCSEYLTCNTTTCVCEGPPVITGISPAGGFCNTNPDKPCSQDSNCASGDTCNTTAPNGIANNFITIFGKNFGAYTEGKSKVTFLGNGSAKDGVSPTTINPQCVDFWRDDQIVIAVPAGVRSGVIQVTNKDNLTDTTNDSIGPKIADFVANNISRPGLCSLSPTQGALSSEVNYQGVNLYSGQAYFGNYQSNVSGLDSTFTNATGLTGTATTPNIQAGESGSFVERTISGFPQYSNYLKFTKDQDPGAGPYIMSFSPSAGSAGQYITIKGAGFGGARGNNHVYFASGNNKAEASYVFPAICANSVWKDNQIIVKAPEGLSDDNYQIQVTLGSTTITTLNLNPNTFQYDHTLALKTSLCKMDPEQGPIDTPVTLWGEYFGAIGSSGLVKFNYNQDANGTITKENDANTINTSVPKAAVTGPVKIVKNSEWGNELNFNVSECTADSDCNNQVCCPATTYKKGRCVDSINDCFANTPTSVFEWGFSTSFDATTTVKYSSCLGASKYLGSCYQGATCPNSPGACSSPATAYQKEVGTCDLSCKGVPGCDASTCTYDATIDKCVKNSSTCTMPMVNTSTGTDDLTIPRIMYWPGKINQHWDLTKGAWVSDADHKSGASIDQLDYCRRFYPTTVSVSQYKNETINSWEDADGNKYTNTKLSYRCVLAEQVCNSDGKIEITSLPSCPTGWTKQANNHCVQDNSSCGFCSDNLSCQTVNSVNRCVSTKVCADADAKCVASTVTGEADKCVVSVEPTCECCCRIGKAKEDCCAGLDCTGKCGQDLTANSNTYGSCSGCGAIGTTMAEHDAACNCTGHSGQFCDISSDHPQGICSDCDKITSQDNCGDHSSACCFDSNKTATTTDDFCRGANGSAVLNAPKGTSDYGYCAYYNCFSATVPPIGDPKVCASSSLLKIGYFSSVNKCVNDCPTGVGNDPCRAFDKNQTTCSNESNCCYDATTLNCLSGNKISGGINNGYCAYYNCQTPPLDPLVCNATPTTTPAYTNISDCTTHCANPPGGAGLDCNNSKATSTCNFGVCNYPGFACLKDTGQGGAYPTCGTCCCQVGNSPDSCATAATPNLHCQADKGSCTGGGRGLCCGCTKDGDCGAIGTTGCGADSCCQARPNVVSTLPAPAATGVCRNAAIKVTFNEDMDATSFSNNFFLLEERAYGTGICPAGSFLTDSRTVEQLIHPNQKNLLARLWDNISLSFHRLFGIVNNQAMATPPDPTKLYCSIPGNVSARQDGTQSSLIFTPSKILSPAAKYYVVVKGDAALDSQTGVLNFAKIGMNERGLDEGKGTFVRSEQIKFNNQSYLNSYIFQFTTLSDQGVNAGICAVDHVSMDPSSYLFKTTTNDLNENDSNINDSTFDTVADRDKLFSADAYSVDFQLLHPVSGYAWDWDWQIDDASIAKISSVPVGLPANRKLVEAQANITDGQTKINATIDMSKYHDTVDCGQNCNAFFVGDGETKSSDIYVFLCNNPWPAVQPDGEWFPWNDVAANCSVNPANCENYNYKFYYCRDAGAAGTLDDLPAINSSPVVRGQSTNLLCSSDKTPCSAVGATCGTDKNGDGIADGLCVWNVLKESYFFRDAGVQGGEIINAADTGHGGEVSLNWQSPAAGASSYKIYYVQSGKATMSTKEISASVACKLQGTNNLCGTTLTGLTNSVPYLFKLTVLSANKTESALSSEVTATPTNNVIPAVPTGLGAEIKNNQLLVSWQDTATDASFFRLYHGVYSLKYGESYDSALGQKQIAFDLDKFGVGDHYLAVAAVSSTGNESGKSMEFNFAKNVCSDGKPNCYEFVFFKNVLTNVDFEQGAPGNVPPDWSIANQQHSSVLISQNEHLSGNQSVLLHQEKGDDYPGTCSQKVCAVGICTWDDTAKTCSFGGTDQCHMDGPAVYHEGETLCWGNSNRIMWLKLAYSLANLDFSQGDHYAINFYYKGKTAADVGVQMSADLGWSSFCVPYSYYAALKPGYTWQGDKLVPTPAAGVDPCTPGFGASCADEKDTCCYFAPAQKQCYSAVYMPNIPAGTYKDWTWYYYPFGYDSNISSWLNKDYKKLIEVGLSIGYNSTMTDGTDLYIDDFTVKKIATTTQVIY